MEKIHGFNQKGVGRSKGKTLMGRISTYGCLAVVCIALTGCNSIKKAAIVGGAAGLGATAGSVISTGALVPIAASTMTASAASVVADQIVEPPIQPLEVTGDATIVNQSPDNFWTLLGKLVGMGGWALILIVLVPMIFSWLLPGPIQFKSKKNRR
jgi:hypothetical protein